ncbi:MAG: hypothetical protein GWP91_22845, partial [Rhodobacterales bacterium]|nr:hypothetical protein [Rhodobacterales bacterium]
MKQVLAGTQTFLRVAASNHLSISAVMRLERRANRLAINLLASIDLAEPVPLLEGVSMGDLGSPEATDELISHALSERIGARQTHISAMLGSAGSALVDDGPEGVDNESFRLVSEELPPVENEREEREEIEDIELDDIERLDVVEEIEELEDLCDEATASPNTPAPTGLEDEVEPPDAVLIDDEPTRIASSLHGLEEEKSESPRPLLSDFDFDFDDDSDEAAETMIFGRPTAKEEPAEVSVAVDDGREPESFDLMPDLAEKEEPSIFDLDEIDGDEELELELELE